MKVGVTGATGFLGRYVVERLAAAGHACRCWFRPRSDREAFGGEQSAIEWIAGDLGDPGAAGSLVEGCDAIIHAALYRPGREFRGAEGDLARFLDLNLLGTIRLIEAARSANVGRFVFISTCAVHEVILPDRPLDETHPTWTTSHYGAHKAALEAFVYSYGLGGGYPICSLRPTGIYGTARPPETSKWHSLIAAVARGEDVTCSRGGKEVHAADVAKAAELLLTADGIAGQAYNCYDRYISEFEVAEIAKSISGSSSRVLGRAPTPKNRIVVDKLLALGMEFGGRPLLERTVAEILERTKG